MPKSGGVLFSPKAFAVDVNASVEWEEDVSERELKRLQHMLAQERKLRLAAEQRCSERMTEAAAAAELAEVLSEESELLRMRLSDYEQQVTALKQQVDAARERATPRGPFLTPSGPHAHALTPHAFSAAPTPTPLHDGTLMLPFPPMMSPAAMGTPATGLRSAAAAGRAHTHADAALSPVPCLALTPLPEHECSTPCAGPSMASGGMDRAQSLHAPLTGPSSATATDGLTLLSAREPGGLSARTHLLRTSLPVPMSAAATPRGGKPGALLPATASLAAQLQRVMMDAATHKARAEALESTCKSLRADLAAAQHALHGAQQELASARGELQQERQQHQEGAAAAQAQAQAQQARDEASSSRSTRDIETGHVVDQTGASSAQGETPQAMHEEPPQVAGPMLQPYFLQPSVLQPSVRMSHSWGSGGGGYSGGGAGVCPEKVLSKLSSLPNVREERVYALVAALKAAGAVPQAYVPPSRRMSADDRVCKSARDQD